MGYYLTDFRFFKNTPMNDFQNTIHFKSNHERDDYFLNGKHFEEIHITKPFNFIRDRLELRIPHPYRYCGGLNYCTFKSQISNEQMYAFVMSYEYLNEETTKITLVFDPVMTYTQGKVLNTLSNINVVREHLSEPDYKRYLPKLRTNDDILKTTTKSYVFQQIERFQNYVTVFTSSADLSADFGTVEKPKLKTSNGSVYDKLVSPVNLYVIPYQSFNSMMKVLSEYPWIAQNLKTILMIPDTFINISDLEDVKTHTVGLSGLKTFKKDGMSKNFTLNKLKYSIDDLCKKYNLNPRTEKHLLRSEYTTLELYSWDGQQVLLDTAFLDDKTGLEIKGMTSIGYYNQVSLFPINYKTSDYEKDEKSGTETTAYRGSFLNNAIIFNSFNEIPTLIDNYNLNLANNSNKRELAESKLITNRVQNLSNPKGELKSRFYDAASMVGNISPTNLFGKFTDEYEFYRTQKAEFADMSLATPTITSQSNSNSFQIANDIYGITAKLSAPSDAELNLIRKYYHMFGYQIDENATQLSDIECMTVCNYVQVKGNYMIPDVDVYLMEQMKALLENGVRFWHNDGSHNPMKQNIMNNSIK